MSHAGPAGTDLSMPALRAALASLLLQQQHRDDANDSSALRAFIRLHEANMHTCLRDSDCACELMHVAAMKQRNYDDIEAYIGGGFRRWDSDDYMHWLVAVRQRVLRCEPCFGSG